MAIDRRGIEFVLEDEGAFKARVQVRPVNRGDLLKLIEENGGTAEHVDLRGLDLSGIDIRGMQLGRIWLMGCILKNGLAQPMVNYEGKGLLPWDLAYGHILGEYLAGKEPNHWEVVPTNLAGSLLMGVDLSNADFRLADLSHTTLNWGKLDGTNLSHSNLSSSSLDQASLERTNLRAATLDGASLESSRIVDADFSEASLRGVSLEGAFISPLTKLDRVQWDATFISSLERNGNYEAAARQYRQLKEWYERAGIRDIAGEFHYRQREAERKAEWQDLRKTLGSVWSRIRHPLAEE